MADLQKWLKGRAQKDEKLYEMYGKPLEKTHKGRYLAIGPKGQTILGDNPTKLLQRAIKLFGSGNFTITRVGYRTFGQWLRIK